MAEIENSPYRHSWNHLWLVLNNISFCKVIEWFLIAIM